MQKTIIAFITLVLIMALTACETDVVFSQYKHTAPGGWEKNEALIFEVDSMPSSGTYAMIMGLRISDSYPFRNLHMVVEQTILPSHQMVKDTLTCWVSDKRGTMLGHGVSFYQYDLPVRRLSYNKGDSISIRVRHNMKREILPGITDIGITLKQSSRLGTNKKK